MDEVIVKGNKYISSKRAAKTTGYAKDYIGQLVRMGKLHAVKVGRSWFVEERGVRELISPTNTSRSTELTENAAALVNFTPKRAPYFVGASIKFPATWSDVKYFYDDSELYPSVADTRETYNLKDESSERVRFNRPKPAPSLISSGEKASIDGIKLIVRDVEAKQYAEREIQSPNVARLSAFDFSNVIRILLSGVIVALAVFFLPLFG